MLGCENSRNADISVVCVTPDVCAAALPHLVRADRLIVLRGPTAGRLLNAFITQGHMSTVLQLKLYDTNNLNIILACLYFFPPSI